MTGRPARRLVQWVSAAFLAELWRRVFRVDARPSFGGVQRFGLWESPTGLYFFDPMREGDAGFYAALYGRLDRKHFASAERPRGEFRLAAEHVLADDRVLDVGCGFGAFRFAVPHASYTGLDPHFSGDPHAEWAHVATLGEHLVANAGAYDVCTAFQVLEHVEDPVGMLADMARAVRPGGRVIVGVPHVPAAHTRIPNYMISAPPHHLTWWTEAALLAAAERVGLTDSKVATAPWTELDGVVYWMARCSPVKCRERHYRHAWSWHASAAFAFACAWLLWKVRPLPSPRPDDEGASLLLVATKPSG